MKKPARFDHPHAYLVSRGKHSWRLDEGDVVRPIGDGKVRIEMTVSEAEARTILGSLDARDMVGIMIGRETLRALEAPCECYECRPECYGLAAPEAPDALPDESDPPPDGQP